MARLIEYVESRTKAVETATGAAGARRVFKGPAIRSDVDALAVFQDEGHATHPGDPSLKLTGVEVAPMKNGAGYEVTATYSNRSTRFSQPPRDQPGYYHFGWQTQDVKVTLPFNKRVVAIVGDDQPDGVRVWSIASVEYTETRLVRPMTVRVTGYPVSAFDVLAVEKRKIHTIHGRDYLYLGGEVAEVDGEAFDVTHSWEIDGGTPFVPDNNQNRIDVEYPSVGTVGNQDMMRLPYTVTLAVPSDNPLDNPHPMIAFYPYPRSPNGWRLLPGAELL